MKLTNEQYGELVDKLADELIYDSMEKQAGVKIGKLKPSLAEAKEYSKSLKAMKNIKKSSNVGNDKLNAKEMAKFYRAGRNKAVALPAAGAGAVAGAGTGAGAYALNKKKKSTQEDIVEKAAELLIEAVLEKQAGVKIGKLKPSLAEAKEYSKSLKAMKNIKKSSNVGNDKLNAKEMAKFYRAGRNKAVALPAAGIGAGAGAGAGVGVYALNKKKKKPTQEDIVEKAAELLIEAVMVKEASYQNASDASVYADASELALNQLGYSMYE